MMMMMIIKEKEAINFRVGHLGERGEEHGKAWRQEREGGSNVVSFQFMCV